MQTVQSPTLAPHDAPALDEIVDTDHHPLSDLDSAAGARLLDRVRRELAADGCSVLRDFIRPAARNLMRREGELVAPHAHDRVETVNAYNTAVDPSLPAGHPARVRMRRGNAFVARDLLPADAVVARLYTHPDFQRFVARCFSLDAVHELADPLAGLCLNVLRPGREHPWHFDVNEFTVTLLTRQCEQGGVFEYCPGIRTPGEENLDAVRAVLHGGHRHRVRRLVLRPGDLQLFRGRYSLHRVSEVGGTHARHCAVLAYCGRPGVIGRAERTRQLFGRVTAAHTAARTVRGDGLLD